MQFSLPIFCSLDRLSNTIAYIILMNHFICCCFLEQITQLHTDTRTRAHIQLNWIQFNLRSISPIGISFNYDFFLLSFHCQFNWPPNLNYSFMEITANGAHSVEYCFQPRKFHFVCTLLTSSFLHQFNWRVQNKLTLREFSSFHIPDHMRGHARMLSCRTRLAKSWKHYWMGCWCVMLISVWAAEAVALMKSRSIHSLRASIGIKCTYKSIHRHWYRHVVKSMRPMHSTSAHSTKKIPKELNSPKPIRSCTDIFHLPYPNGKYKCAIHKLLCMHFTAQDRVADARSGIYCSFESKNFSFNC